jgi:hypothetical protein
MKRGRSARASTSPLARRSSMYGGYQFDVGLEQSRKVFVAPPFVVSLKRPGSPPGILTLDLGRISRTRYPALAKGCAARGTPATRWAIRPTLKAVVVWATRNARAHHAFMRPVRNPGTAQSRTISRSACGQYCKPFASRCQRHKPE